MNAKDDARNQLADILLGHLGVGFTVDKAIDALLSDVPLLMTALDAKRVPKESFQQEHWEVLLDLFFDDAVAEGDRWANWLVPWREVE